MTETVEHFNLGVSENAKEIVIRRGEALPLQKPKAITLSGTIGAPSAYFTQRFLAHNLMDVKKILVRWSRLEKYITFCEDPTDTQAAQIDGLLRSNPELAAFGINSDKTFELVKMRDFLRVRRHLFASADAHNVIMDSLKKFSVKLDTTIKNENDNRGNTDVGAKTIATTDIPLDFTLSMPLFIGSGKESFKVEIAFEVRSAGASFWFISTELPELLEKSSEDLLAKELEVFRQAGCAVLEV
jgi:hypothetical protein